MAWSPGLDVDVGNPTKASEYDNLADNPEFLQVALDVEHDFDTASASGAHKDITFAAGTTSITMLDDMWIGLGASKGRIAFDDTPATDQIEIADANLLLGDDPTFTAEQFLHIRAATSAGISIDCRGGTGATANLIMNSDRGSDGQESAVIRFKNNHANHFAAIKGVRGSTDAKGDLTFETQLSERLRIDEDGNVGIGTASPSGQLDVQGAVATPGTMYLTTAELSVVDGDKLGQINFSAPLETSGSDAILVAASIWAEATASFGTTTNPTAIVFATGNSEVATEKMRIDNLGNVGIGTADPTTPLNTGYSSTGLTIGDGTGTEGIVLYSGTATTLSAIRFADGGGGNYDQGNIIYNHNVDSMSFGVDRSARLTILSSGNVGIGTTSPTSLLAVNGEVTIGGTTAAETDLLVEQNMWIGGDDAGASRARAADGLTILSAGSETEGLLELKAPSLTHGGIGVFETDTLMLVNQRNTDGGVNVLVFNEDDADDEVLYISTYGGTAQAGVKTTAADALITFYAAEISGASDVAVTADGNVFSIAVHTGGVRMLIDEDGDNWAVTAQQTFDFMDDGITERDDLALLSAYDYVRNPKGVIANEWERFIEDEGEDVLIKAGILGDTVANGGLTCYTQLARATIGAVRQLDRLKAGRSEVDILQDRVSHLEGELAFAYREIEQLQEGQLALAA